MYSCIFITNDSTLQYIAIHFQYITVYCITFPNINVYYSVLHYNLLYITLHLCILRYISVYYSLLQSITVQCIALHIGRVQYITLHPIYYSKSQYIALN